jgi:hypothetical protein
MSDWTPDEAVDGLAGGLVGLDGGLVGLDGGLVGLDGGLDGPEGGFDGGADGGLDELDAVVVVWLAVLGVIDEHELNSSDIRPNTTAIPIFFAERARGRAIAKTHGRRRNAEGHFIMLGPQRWISGDFHPVYRDSGQYGRGRGV